MKKLLLTLVFLIPLLLFSGCVQIEDVGLAGFLGMGEPQYTATERLSISAESVLPSVEAGRNTTLIFRLDNTGNTTLRNINTSLTDSCVFEPSHKEKGPFDLEPGEFKDWEWGLEAGDVKMARDCDLRYSTSYQSQAKAWYDVSVISEEEYLRLKKKGVMENKTSLEYYKTDTPVDIQISLSEKQPILEDEAFYLTVKLRNQGEGTVGNQKIKAGDLTLEYPGFLDSKGCQGITESKSANPLKTKDSLTFYKKKTPPITCKFKAGKDIKILKEDSFKITVRYKYAVDKQLSVKVTPQ